MDDLTISTRLEALEREVAALKESTHARANDEVEFTAQGGQFRLTLRMTDYGSFQMVLFVRDAEGSWKEAATRTLAYARRDTRPPHTYGLF